jgi:hypothetical protein
MIIGRLASREKDIIETIKSGGGLFAPNITIDARLALTAIRAAASEKRNFSSLCAVALQEYTENHRADPIDSQFLLKLQAALADIDRDSQKNLIDEFEKLIASATRKRRLETISNPS